MNKRERDERYTAMRSMGCLACSIEGHSLWCGRPEVHHLNAGGHAGQKRRGDDATICLGAWHHRGQLLPGMTRDQMTHKYGPSLAHDSKQFRFAYGSDDQLLAMTNERLKRIA